MSEVFLKIVNMSCVASWLILAVILLRLALKKAPKWINCLLWGLVAVRLLCPVSFESSLSLIPNEEPIMQELLMVQPSEIHDAPVFDPAALNLTDIPPLTADTSIDQAQSETMLVTYVWVIGLVVMLAYAAFSYIRLWYQVRASLQLQENIWLCDEITMPFLLGIWSPKIYIPSGVEEDYLSYIIDHENAHLKRRDHWWKPLGFLILAIHWFNPLVWVAYVLLCRDIELACDEKVIHNYVKNEAIEYSKALLSCGTHRRMFLVCPLAFGEVGVKERVKRVLNYKKPSLWALVAAFVAYIMLVVCFLTNPTKSVSDRESSETTNGELGEAVELFRDTFESGDFILEGESVFYGEKKTAICHVVERHNGEDYRIERLNKTYIKEDNQYYIDEGEGQGISAVPATEEMAQIEEMFNRKSEIANYGFSDLYLDSQYSTEVSSLAGEKIACVCQEYHVRHDLEESSPPLKVYFCGDDLYAMQSRNDERFIFYVEAWGNSKSYKA